LAVLKDGIDEKVKIEARVAEREKSWQWVADGDLVMSYTLIFILIDEFYMMKIISEFASHHVLRLSRLSMAKSSGLDWSGQLWQ
jgi:hypothetical protein